MCEFVICFYVAQPVDMWTSEFLDIFFFVFSKQSKFTLAYPFPLHTVSHARLLLCESLCSSLCMQSYREGLKNIFFPHFISFTYRAPRKWRECERHESGKCRKMERTVKEPHCIVRVHDLVSCSARFWKSDSIWNVRMKKKKIDDPQKTEKKLCHSNVGPNAKI